jgi:prepilin-type N-terminal cleavage/methylation domain-containing protein
MLEPMMVARRRTLGFTIIELMTVLVIAGVLLVVAAPAFNDMLAKRRLEGHVNELVTDLAYAKSEAVQRNRHVELLAGGGGVCYSVAVMTIDTPPVGNCDCTAAPGARCTTAGTTELKTVTLTSGASVTNGSQFIFEPVRGSLAPIPPAPAPVAASAVVALGSRNHTVTVAANGRVGTLTP